LLIFRPVFKEQKYGSAPFKMLLSPTMISVRLFGLNRGQYFSSRVSLGGTVVHFPAPRVQDSIMTAVGFLFGDMCWC